jgi:hypothetical protein
MVTTSVAADATAVVAKNMKMNEAVILPVLVTMVRLLRNAKEA